jgi:hypothetical protein
MTYRPPTDLPTDPLFQPKMAEIRRSVVITRNMLGFCGKWGYQPTYRPPTDPCATFPHTPMRGFAPTGAWVPPLGLTPDGLFTLKK